MRETDRDDGIDNDDNGYVDCDDFDRNDDPAWWSGGDEIQTMASTTTATPTSTATLDRDDDTAVAPVRAGLRRWHDNDGDYVDCDDWDCDDDAACVAPVRARSATMASTTTATPTSTDDWDCDDDAACGGSSESEVWTMASTTTATPVDCDDWTATMTLHAMALGQTGEDEVATISTTMVTHSLTAMTGTATTTQPIR